MPPLVAPTYNCDACPIAASSSAAAPAIVQLAEDGVTWKLLAEAAPVHLVALFRDPAVEQGRVVPMVLDLAQRPDGRLTAGRSCWVQQFLKALGKFPAGITISLDNGVRCPCGVQMGESVYRARALVCHSKTRERHATLFHPDGQPPGIVICDKDLTCSLSEAGQLTRSDGTPWTCPKRFIDAVGDSIRYLGVDALIAAHPVVLQRRQDYRDRFRQLNMMQRVRVLARMPI